MAYDVSVVPCGDYAYETVRPALEKAVAAVGGLDFVRPGMKIALKTNLVIFASPDRAATTHPMVLRALCDLLTERGASVVIGDSPGGIYTPAYLKSVYRACGLTDLVREGVSLNENVAEKQADFPEAVSARHFTYTAYLDDADAIIDVCKLKTHGMMGMSCAAKNFFGTIPGTMKPEYHFRYPTYEAFADMLIDLNDYFKPRLAVCDAVVGMEGNGPTAGTPRKIGCLLVSPSTHKLDLVAASIIGLTKEKVPTLQAAHRRGLIPENAEDLAVSGDPAAFFVPDFKNVATLSGLGFNGASGNVLHQLFGKTVGASAIYAYGRRFAQDSFSCAPAIPSSM